jgi:hypothetical protein
LRRWWDACRACPAAHGVAVFRALSYHVDLRYARLQALDDGFFELALGVSECLVLGGCGAEPPERFIRHASSMGVRKALHKALATAILE